ncbi:melatonin receptor type 1B-like [Patiria miniata]|uniref:G-protein coupled receptors family 1 profile domain-containing protein n=1 Tax=Patiria miniata TaxID=46514 RepID=A0A913Z6Y9_PATMI|nr:melatonin receptor type 1B-like [Patiria miniata]
MASNQNLSSGDFENGTGDEWPESGVAVSPSLGAVKTIIACLAVLGNSVVIIVMLLRHKMFSSFTNRLILHQSCIDLAAGLVFFCSTVLKSPNTVVVSKEGNLSDKLICSLLFSDFFLWCLNVTSTYNLVAISLERFVATCHMAKWRNSCTKAKLRRGAMVTSWVVGFVYCSHMTLMVEPVQGRCQFVPISPSLKICIGVLALSIEYVVPVLIMTYSYVKILTMLTKNLANPVNPRQHIIRRAKKNILVTILLVIIVFAICWTPTECYYVGTLLLDLQPNEPVYTAFTTLLACNLFINPIIYSFIYKHFRAQLSDLLTLGRYRRNRVENIPQG